MPECPTNRRLEQRKRRRAAKTARPVVRAVPAVVDGAAVAADHAHAGLPARRRKTSSSEVSRVVRRYSGSPSSAIDVAEHVHLVVAVDGHLDQPFGGDGRHADASPAPATSSSLRGADIDGDETGAFEQRVGRARHDESAGVDHHDVVAHLLHVVEEVSGHQHRDPERAEPGDEHQHLFAAERIEAGGRLVEQHQFRVADQRLGELRALPHARGEPADRPEPGLVEADEVEDVGCPLARCPRRQAAELAERRHHVGGGLIERQAIVLGHVAEPRPDLDRDRRRRRSRRPRSCPRSVWRCPSSRRNIVVLPAPFAPTRPTRPRGSVDREVVEGRHTRVLLGETVDTEEGTGSSHQTAVESGTW